jgi:hypothetical protein
MSARDLARFGLLYLRRGRWGEKQIIPESWIDDSIKSYVEKSNPTYRSSYGYGYLWWTVNRQPFKDLGMFCARGTGGQEIAILPKANLVIVHRVNTYTTFGGGLQKKFSYVNNLMRFKIIKMILDARTGPPKADPDLVPVEKVYKLQPKVKLDPDFCKNAVGTYDFGRFRLEIKSIATSEGPRLDITRTLKHCYHLIPLSKTKFFVEDLEIYGSFELDDAGMPARVTIEFMPGYPRTGTKISPKRQASSGP